jgi:hypothetical protein
MDVAFCQFFPLFAALRLCGLLSDLLCRYVQEGGGLYVYGVSYTRMGQGWANDSLNKFLQWFGAQVLFEVLRDEPREQRPT